MPITGTLQALVEADVKARVAGEVVELAAREGERVEKGQVLARIDPAPLRARVAARDELQAARSQRVDTARAELAIARQELENAVLRAPFAGTVAAPVAIPPLTRPPVD